LIHLHPLDLLRGSWLTQKECFCAEGRSHEGIKHLNITGAEIVISETGLLLEQPMTYIVLSFTRVLSVL